MIPLFYSPFILPDSCHYYMFRFVFALKGLMTEYTSIVLNLYLDCSSPGIRTRFECLNRIFKREPVGYEVSHVDHPTLDESDSSRPRITVSTISKSSTWRFSIMPRSMALTYIGTANQPPESKVA